MTQTCQKYDEKEDKKLEVAVVLNTIFLWPNASYKSVMVVVLTCKVKIQVIKNIDFIVAAASDCP